MTWGSCPALFKIEVLAHSQTIGAGSDARGVPFLLISSVF